jgi:hypothetical protein
VPQLMCIKNNIHINESWCAQFWKTAANLSYSAKFVWVSCVPSRRFALSCISFLNISSQTSIRIATWKMLVSRFSMFPGCKAQEEGFLCTTLDY